LMGAEADALCGAGYRERSDETGSLKDLSHTWTLSMGFLTILMVINCVFSWLATQNKAIE
ncbi:hypothetical protein KC219_21550, partial [Mycobacterium tuberculosis]|nr:hypothetical protein [Mycobacterium tuberculosis]